MLAGYATGLIELHHGVQANQGARSSWGLKVTPGIATRLNSRYWSVLHTQASEAECSLNIEISTVANRALTSTVECKRKVQQF